MGRSFAFIAAYTLICYYLAGVSYEGYREHVFELTVNEVIWIYE